MIYNFFIQLKYNLIAFACETHSNGGVECLDIIRAVEVDVYEIAFAEVVDAALYEVVLGEAPLEAHALLLVQLVVHRCLDIKGVLAVRDRIAQPRRHKPLLVEELKIFLALNLLYHY